MLGDSTAEAPALALCALSGQHLWRRKDEEAEDLELAASHNHIICSVCSV